MISKLTVALHSPAFWSLVGAFVVQGLTAILPQLHGTASNIVSLILLALSAYLHPSEVHTAGATGMMGSISLRQ